MDAQTKKLFMDLSTLTTGLDELDGTLAPGFYDRLLAAFPTEVPALLNAFDALPTKNVTSVQSVIIAHVTNGKAWLVVIKEIINLWYLGSMYAGGVHQPPHEMEPYLKQRMYSVIGAPVRGFSELRHGYWTNKPA